MLKISSLFLIITLSCIAIASVQASNWGCAWNWGSSCSDPGQITYCQGNSCGITQGQTAVTAAVGPFFTQRTISQYVTSVVLYFLTFVTLVAVLYVLWAGFQLMTSAGDDEKLKKARLIITYVLSGIVLMWIAYWIVILIIDAIN